MTLIAQPRWHDAAQLLVNGFADFDDMEARIALLDTLCDSLGGSLYPAFLQILCHVQRLGDAEAKAMVTDTLLHALMTERLPTGRIPAWGAAELVGDSAFGQTRSLGPIEFLCAWYAQPTSLPCLSRGAFVGVAEDLLQLVSGNERAHRLYRHKLMADADSPLSGSLSARTRAALRSLAQQWTADTDTQSAVTAFLATLEPAGGSLQSLQGNPFLR